jgi:hypothetical protein
MPLFQEQVNARKSSVDKARAHALEAAAVAGLAKSALAETLKLFQKECGEAGHLIIINYFDENDGRQTICKNCWLENPPIGAPSVFTNSRK